MTDTSEAQHPIITLARMCVSAGLKYTDAKALFRALYVADALKLTNGNAGKAADLMQTHRGYVRKQRQPSPCPIIEEET